MTSTTANRPPINKNFIWSEELADFLSALDAYNPTLPNEVTQYYLAKAGVPAEDPRIVKLTSLAADKFIAGIVHEAKQLAIIQSRHLKKASKQKLLEETFDMDNLERTLEPHKIHIKRRRLIAHTVPDSTLSTSVATPAVRVSAPTATTSSLTER
mmetsp:Transcript_20929/g.21042  ORF Transcript_20929/g.21042 Transcript_20929/m.21042 type:complete len:155 (+) Transcript_20929:251-715(+)|eukprot:CAMPEP_0182435338 /NCGR_PEP_ID=MMETSP1167-20130531/75213_1 /TAXON_ID=2988 /ORGANISM="Mallomonas Sp, Strain CCMP3275" /LENGTH=154 /DNA_ID=CAMNT_0024626301 /DNA_START=171 /DNA_END=635 /DNA_ORIENTATION=-